eukprot:379719-Pelagomonas_calceolata.AAC.1
MSEEEKKEHATDTTTAHVPAPNLICFPNLQNALKSGFDQIRGIDPSCIRITDLVVPIPKQATSVIIR